MALWFAAFLGLVQGLTEFLPISSTAHLRIAPALFGQADPGAAFSAVIQLGTLLAVIVYFARDLFVTMPRAFVKEPKSPDGRLPVYIALGTLPIVVAGLALQDYIKGTFRSLYVVCAALAVVGAVMLAADRRATLRRTLADITLSDAMLIGAAQSLALIPGVSRSGSTIVCALLLGIQRPDAARFSFLLGIPAIAGAGIFELKDAFEAMGSDPWAPILVGTGAAFVSGYASIAWLLRYLGSKTLAPFAVYRIALALVLAGLVFGSVV